MYHPVLLSAALCISVAACIGQEGVTSRDISSPPAGNPGFTLLAPEQTGVRFTNQLRGNAFLTNAVAHNGSGVALGDVNGDGLVDIFLCNLQGPSRLYRNLGNWRFEDATIGPAACNGQFSTGATLADVDGDRDLDLLVNGISAGTRLFLNDGKGILAEKMDSGLSRTNSGTSLALADIDADGDLDLYSAHYSDAMFLFDPLLRFGLGRNGQEWTVSKVNGQPATMARWTNRFTATADGRVRELPEAHALYRNDGAGKFTPIQSAAFFDEHGKPLAPFRDWGLAVMFRDLNRDGAPDIYVCNDNASPDRIWINRGDGTFRPADSMMFRHTSRSAMGIDFADINRDGHEDFIVVDMLARDHTRRMMQLVKDYPNALLKDRIDQRPEYNRNSLFFGRSNGTFHEAALMAGVAATDWSWCPIFIDVDFDGYEDLLITNGFEFDVLDQDGADSRKGKRYTPDDLTRFFGAYPQFHTKNVALRNRGDGTFEPAEKWGFSKIGISNGMALGDLDNDGDMDVVVNNLNDCASLYRNDAAAPRVAIRLNGVGANTAGIGAKIRVVGGPVMQTQEFISGGRYLSGDQEMRAFAAYTGKTLEVQVTWRNGMESILTNVQPNRIYEISYLSAMNVERVAKTLPKSIFKETNLNVSPAAAAVATQPLLPRAFFKPGRWTLRDGKALKEDALAVADFDRDGDVDSILTQEVAPGKFPSPMSARIWRSSNGTLQPAELLENIGQIRGASFADFDSNGSPDLAIACEWGPIRVFKNAGGRFSDVTEQLGLHEFPGCWTSVASGDFDSDGAIDFVAGNLGCNTEYELYQPSPLRIYFEDVNSDGIFEFVEAWKNGDQWMPMRDRLKLAAALPDLARRFTNHLSFARATIRDILGEKAAFVEARHLESTLFLNRGGKFERRTLPLEAQLAPVNAIAIADFDRDGVQDIFLAQNSFSGISDLNRDDSGRGLLLLGKGDGSFTALDSTQSGINLFGEQVGAIAQDVNGDGRDDLAVIQRNAESKLFINNRPD